MGGIMFVRFIKAFSLTVLLSQVFGCGGGSNTNGTLVIAAPTAVTAGKTFQVTASVTSTAGIVTIPVTFSSSDQKIIPDSSADTNSTGVATAQLLAANIINADKDVIITAHAGGLTSSAKVTVRANKLIFTPPSKASLTGTAGSGIEFFITGAGSLVKYTDADGLPLGGQVVSLKVNTIISGVTDVRWHDKLVDTSYFAANPMSFTTLSDGSLPNSIVSIVANSPPSGGSSDFGVNFIVSVTDPLFGIMSIPGDIAFTIATP
jgi:hypothetical protein